MGIEALLQSQVIGLDAALAGKLGLSGGTLTGALLGTDISLSGSLTVAASQGITSSNFTRITGSNQPARGIAVRDGQINFASNVSLYWSTSLDPTANAAGMSLVTNGTSALEQRNGATAQQWFLSNTYTDASNYERGFARWNLNVFEIGTEAAGTGVARNFSIRTGGVERLRVNAGGGVVISSATYVLSDLFASTWIGLGGFGAPFGWIKGQANGVFGLYNSATTDFDRLQFGGTSSSFPSLKRSGTTIVVRLADDSADAGIAAGAATFSGTVILSALPTSNPGVAGQLWNDGGTLRVA